MTTTDQIERTETMSAPPIDRACDICPCPFPSRPGVWRCPDCDVSWWRTLGGWFLLDMECACGARAHPDWTWVEWYSDSECGKCYRERTSESA